MMRIDENNPFVIMAAPTPSSAARCYSGERPKMVKKKGDRKGTKKAKLYFVFNDFK